MRVESSRADGGDAEVATTGARFRFLADGRIEADQRLPSPRGCFVASFEGPRAPWRIEASDAERVKLRSEALAAEVRDDSTVLLAKVRPTGCRLVPSFAPEFTASAGSTGLSLDSSGGCGVFPDGPWGARFRMTASLRARTWTELGFGFADELRLAVFPPRPPDPRHAGSRIAHEGTPHAPLPPDDVVAEAAATCRVLALHAYFWRAAPWPHRLVPGRYFLRSNSWRSARHVPSDAAALAHTMGVARRHGMRVVLYVSPRYSSAPDVVEEIGRILDFHAPDGLYVDSVTPRGGGAGVRELDARMRRIRALLGPERLLYLHPGEEPFGSALVRCPFVEARADFVLRGSGGRGGLALDPFLRWCVSGRSVSGAEGVWCHYGSSEGAFARFVRGERAPTPGEIDAARRNGVGLWRRSAWGADALRAFDRQPV